MLILLLLYFASHSWAKDYPRDSNYTLKYVPSCPDAGYFFQRDPGRNALEAPCYLCFCQGRNTAICWQRENRKCDLKHYKHNNSVVEKESRVKRSPLGFGDVFFKDAARGVFNKAEPEQCKPYESSFSEGCPPADWCTGCTVCDCDADGHWDCHILSFCDDEKDKGKKSGKNAFKYPKPRKSGSSKSSKQKKTNIPQTTRRPPIRTKSTTKRPPYKRFNKGPSKATKPRSLIQKGKSVKPLIIKQNEKNPKVVKSSPSRRVLNGSETDVHEQLVRGMMAAMQKMWARQVTSSIPDIVTMIQKRSSQNKKGNTPVKYKKVTSAKRSGKTHTYNRSLFVRKQKREEQKKELQRKRELQKKEAIARSNAAKKQVPKAVNRNNKPINRSNNKSTKKPTKSTNRPATKKPYGKPNNIPKNSKNKRSKREVGLNNQIGSSNSYNISDTGLHPTANIETPTATEKEIIVQSPASTSLIDGIITTNSMYRGTNTNYYEYTLYEITTEVPEVKNVTNYEDTKVEVVKKLDNVSDVGHRLGKANFNIADGIPNEVANEIKITKWSEIKMIQDKQNATKQSLNRTNGFDNKNGNKINETKSSAIEDHRKQIEDRRKQIMWKDIGRKVDKTTKKYSLLRMVNTHNYKNKRGNEINLDNHSGISLSNKIENLRNVLKRLLGEFRANNSSSLVNKRKKTNAIKYLKKFFNTIFFKESNKTSINQRMRNNNHTIQMLCESFGPCVVNRRNRDILMTKIKDLNNETVEILKSLRIIKGLLRLVDIPYDTAMAPLNKTSNFKRDIRKLNIILKKSFDDAKAKEELSETQRTQINYIKKNTKVFTQSVAKFTKILNEIIDLISVKSNIENQRRWNFETKPKFSKYNMTKLEPVKKFKQLLQNYNIVHNAFIAKMIHMFTSFQSNHNNVTPTNNHTVDVTGAEFYSKKVIKNLNKLKNLATALNPLRRKKRHAVRQDNAVEYLLMLMEYMFQQNQLDNSPVNDGIDLLIEAIKNAPDIKSVKKKVLKNNPLGTNDVKIAEPISNKNASDEDSISDNNITIEGSINKISNEDSYLNKISIEDSKSILNMNDNSSSLDQGETIDDENQSDLQSLRFRNGNIGTANVQAETDANIANEQDDMNFTNVRQTDKQLQLEQVDNQKENNYESSTDMPTKVYMAEDDTLALDFNTRLEKASGELSKKHEIYNSELDEENNVEDSLGVTKAVTIREHDTEMPLVTIGYSDINTAKSKTVTRVVRPKSNKKKSKIHNNESKSLERIDDVKKIEDSSESVQVINNTLDQGPRKSPKVKNKNEATTTGQVSPTVSKPAQLTELDLSDSSKEDSEEKSKVKIKKPEDVMVKKEQELLNSLDYGTEASIVDDSEPKDIADEKFLSDYFAE